MHLEGNQLDESSFVYFFPLFLYLIRGRGVDSIDIMRTNSKRLCIILYCNQLYSYTLGSLVFHYNVGEWLNTSVLQNISYAKFQLLCFNMTNNCSSIYILG